MWKLLAIKHPDSIIEQFPSHFNEAMKNTVEGTLGLRLHLVLWTNIPLNLFFKTFFVNLRTYTPLLHFEIFE